MSGYFGRILVKVDGTTGEAWIRIMVDGDSEGSEGFPARVIEVEPSGTPLHGVLDVLWAFMTVTNYWWWWPLRPHLISLASTRVITLYTGTPIGRSGEPCHADSCHPAPPTI